MKLKDGVKFGLGFAIGQAIWYGLICNFVDSLMTTFSRSDYWKEMYESSLELYKEFCKIYKPKNTRKEKNSNLVFKTVRVPGRNDLGSSFFVFTR